MTPFEIPFAWLAHLAVVPARIGERSTRLVFDSGIGLAVVRTSLADDLGLHRTGETFTGRRMSGEETTLPLAVAPSIALDGLERRDVTVGLFDPSGFPPEFDDVAGFLPLGFFESAPVTVDYAAGRLVLETAESLAVRRAAGAVVPLELHCDGPALDAFARLAVPGADDLLVEIDMGSDTLILDERFAAGAGVAPSDPDVRREDGIDAWGEAYSRTYARVRGAIHLHGAPALAQRDPDAIFQRLIHDGLLGTDYLRRHAVTWDVAAAELILG